MFLKCCVRNDNDAALYLAPLGYFIRGERKKCQNNKGWFIWVIKEDRKSVFVSCLSDVPETGALQ